MKIFPDEAAAAKFLTQTAADQGRLFTKVYRILKQLYESIKHYCISENLRMHTFLAIREIFL